MGWRPLRELRCVVLAHHPVCYVVLCIEFLMKNETKLDGLAPPPVYVTLGSNPLRGLRLEKQRISMDGVASPIVLAHPPVCVTLYCVLRSELK